jgi:6-pyruvoyltetrahydropterin/6-carboxytetrahydropterin synthase
MAEVLLTRVVTFSAAHRYYRPEWSRQRNVETFGPCANEHGHGHTYHCHVTVAGPLNRDTAMVMNLAELDRVLQEEVLERFDHRHMNFDVPEFAPGKQIPTSEALAVFVWRRIAKRLPSGIRLKRVRVQEDPFLYAEYDGTDEAAAGSP